MDNTTDYNYNDELPPHYKFYARTMLALTAIGFLAATTATEGGYRLDSPVLYLTLFLLAYPAPVFFGLRNQSIQRQQHAETIFSHIDALLMGAVITLTHFNLIAAVLLIGLIELSALMTGGSKKATSSFVALTIGAIFAILIYTVHFSPTTAEVFISAAIIPAIGCCCTLIYFARNKFQKLMAIQNELALEQKQLKLRSYKLSKYIPPPVWQSINSGKEIHLGTQRKKLTIFFSDVKGFSELAEEMEPEALAEVLNNYLTEMSSIAIKHGGTIDKFIGDSIMVFFGDTQSHGIKADSVACISMAIEMRKHMALLQQKWRSRGIAKPLEIRMGINTGFCTVGNFGTESRMDYTLLGKDVNLASRLESLAKPGQILIAQETYSLIHDTVMCRDKGKIAVKGFRQPVSVYEIVDFRRDLGSQRSFVSHESNGFSLYMDSDKVRNYEKEKIVQALEEAAEKIRDKITT